MALCGYPTTQTQKPCANPVGPGTTRCAAGHPCAAEAIAGTSSGATAAASPAAGELDMEELLAPADAQPPLEAQWKRPEFLSPSSAQTYHQCPKRFELKYVRGYEDPSGVEAVRGTFVHRVLERVVGPSVPLADRTLDLARVVAREEWNRFERESDELASLGLGEQGLREMRQCSWGAITGYFAMEDPRTLNVVSTERRLRGTVGGVPFKGFVDRLTKSEDGALCLDDYKTGKAPKEPWRATKLLQVYQYAAFLDEEDEPVGRVRLLYVSAGEVVAGSVDEGLILSTKEGLAHTWGKVQDDYAGGSFQPKPGRLCAWCPFADGRCPAVPAP